MYKRSEDGIVLVDQDACRGWRMCVTGCPYKKVYFNHRTGKAEKCTLCYPRIEVGLPTVCSETCVGRLRYLGLFLYDADRVTEAAATENEQDLYEAQLDLILDPNDPRSSSRPARRHPAGLAGGGPASPVYALAKKYKVALPLHPEYRTMPMVWYIPPLSPVVDALRETGNDAEDAGNLFGALNALRIPIEYLAELFTAGDVGPVKTVAAGVLAAMRAFMRDSNLGNGPPMHDPGRSRDDEEEMFGSTDLLAIAKYEDRYVIPEAHTETAQNLEEIACSLDYEGAPGMYEQGPFGRPPDGPCPSRGRDVPRPGAAPAVRDHRARRGAMRRQGQPAQLGRPRGAAGDAGHAAEEEEGEQ
jgi:nitrate reductase beta subunit